MFFANALKDYVDQLNELYLLLNDNFTVLTFLKSFFIYFFDSIKVLGFYFLSCKWLTDFIELPCTFKLNYNAIFEGKNILETNVLPSYFEFLETKPLTYNLFSTGFLNSFFLALPFSVPHLLTLRFFLINGLPAGLFAAAGTILGQFVFFSCVLFGFESLLIPFLSFEPLNYILGFIILVNVLHYLLHKPSMKVLNISQKSFLFPLFGVNFLLAWTEQTCVFQYFGNLTINSFPNILQGANIAHQTVPSQLFSHFILPNSFYLLGLLVGSVLWTTLFGFGVMLLRNKVSELSQTPFMLLNEKIHNGTLIILFTFCLTSVPYYGFNYLVAGPLGFISQDKALTVFSPKTFTVINTADDASVYQQQIINPIPFDRSKELQRINPTDTFVFEDSSFEPENSWVNRETFKNSRGQRIKGKTIGKEVKKMAPVDNKGRLAEANKLYKNFYKTDLDTISLSSEVEPLDTIQEEEKKKKEKEKVLRGEVAITNLASLVFDPLAYSYYVSLDEKTIIPELLVRNFFREKFYSNPVYQALVKLDMKAFLQGQPQAYNLTNIDEADLYNRHLVLQNYLNSIQDYKKSEFNKPQRFTYSGNVYNQQFKGSLDLIRHYFSVSLSSDNIFVPLRNVGENSEQQGANQKVLKFDQRLYNIESKQYNPFLHEELFDSQTQIDSFRDSESVGEDSSANQVLFLNKFPNQMEEVDTTPFYIGWDSSLRKFLVKKAWTSGISLGNEAISNKSEKQLSTKLPNYFSFQSWPLILTDDQVLSQKALVTPYTPLSGELLTDVSNLLRLPIVFDSESAKTASVNASPIFLEDHPLPIYNWSPIVQTQIKDFNKYIDLGNTLPPQFGGFAWPGNLHPKTFMSKILPQIEKKATLVKKPKSK